MAYCSSGEMSGCIFLCPIEDTSVEEESLWSWVRICVTEWFGLLMHLVSFFLLSFA